MSPAARAVDDFLKSWAPTTDSSRPYINPKQHFRILRRIESRRALARAMLCRQQDKKLPAEKSKKTYKHESRHKHAKKRQRIKGRFCSKPTEKEKDEKSYASSADDEEEPSSQQSDDSQSTRT